MGLLNADGIEEWDSWRPTGLLSSAVACNSPRPSHQPAEILSTFNLLVQTSTIINDNLQCDASDTNKKASREQTNTFHRLQSKIRLDSLVAQAEAHDAPPQAINLMLATVSCLPNLVPAASDPSHRNLSCSNTIAPDVHRSLASVAEGVKQPGAVTLSPVSDVYLYIIENRNRKATSPFSREALESIKSVPEIRARYNGTWLDTNLDPRRLQRDRGRPQKAGRPGPQRRAPGEVRLREARRHVGEGLAGLQDGGPPQLWAMPGHVQHRGAGVGRPGVAGRQDAQRRRGPAGVGRGHGARRRPGQRLLHPGRGRRAAGVAARRGPPLPRRRPACAHELVAQRPCLHVRGGPGGGTSLSRTLRGPSLTIWVTRGSCPWSSSRAPWLRRGARSLISIRIGVFERGKS